MLIHSIKLQDGLAELHKLSYVKFGDIKVYYRVMFVKEGVTTPSCLINVSDLNRYPKWLKGLLSIPDLTEEELAIFKFRHLIKSIPNKSIEVISEFADTGVMLIKYLFIDYRYLNDEISYYYCICNRGVKNIVLREVIEARRVPRYILGLLCIGDELESTHSYFMRSRKIYLETAMRYIETGYLKPVDPTIKYDKKCVIKEGLM